MKLKTTRPWIRELTSVLIGPAIWLALLLLVASGKAYPLEEPHAGSREVATALALVMAGETCSETRVAPEVVR